MFPLLFSSTVSSYSLFVRIKTLAVCGDIARGLYSPASYSAARRAFAN